MSRFGDGDGGDQPLELFRGNVERALKGRRGQKALREMREALLALPEKKLASSALAVVDYDDNDKPVAKGFCAIGAYAFYKRVKAGEPVEEVLEALKQDPDNEGADGEEFDTIQEGQRQGLVYALAWEMAWMNDEGLGQWKETISEEERWTRYMAWVESQLQPVEVV